MGRVGEPEKLLSLQYALNDSIPVELNFRGYRRLAMDGHFNADIPIASLRSGPNTIEVEGRFLDGVIARQVVTLTRLAGSSPLPLRIDWSTTADPQDAGQYVDGHWRLGEQGLRTAHMGYDRLFLIGDMAWRDYQITAEVTVHEVAPNTGPLSGGNGLGVVMRFAGHVVGGRAGFRSLSQSGVTNRSAAWPGYGGSAARRLPRPCSSCAATSTRIPTTAASRSAPARSTS